MIPDTGNTFRDRDIGQVTAALEGIRLDSGDAIWNGDARQAGAAPEGRTPDTGDAVRYRDTCQAPAIREGRDLDTSDTFRNRDAHHVIAPLEGIPPDARDYDLVARYARRQQPSAFGDTTLTDSVDMVIGHAADYAALRDEARFDEGGVFRILAGHPAVELLKPRRSGVLRGVP